MTQLEYIEQMAALDQESREANRANGVQMQLIEARHRENMNNELDRYHNEKRRQQADYNTRKDDIEARRKQVKIARAITRTEEEKALI